MKSLTKIRGAYPFFIAVFVNSFVDLGHKITVQNTIFKLYDEQTQIIATAVLNGLILLPYILLMSPAGFLSDRFKRVSVLRYTAWVVVALCGLIWLSYSQGWFWIAFAATFLLAVQSAVYSPAKFSYIKDLFGLNRLTEANGVVASLSIIAILAGTFFFSILFETFFIQNVDSPALVLQAIAPIGLLLIVSGGVELWMTYRLPEQTEYATDKAHITKAFDWQAFFRGRLFVEDLQPFRSQQVIRLAIVGLATFWGIGQVLLAAYPSHFKSATGLDNTIIIQGILACSGVGIAIGAFLAGKLSRSHIEVGMLPFAALGIATGLVILPSLMIWQLAALDFLLIGVCGGLFIVPLNALIQYHAHKDALGRTLAANNWVQNVTMLSFLVLTASFALVDIPSKSLLYMIALVAVAGFSYTLFKLPQSLLRLLITFVLRGRYHIFVQGLKHIPTEGGALLLGNHISWIDWALIQIASPRPIRFVMIRNIYQLWYLKWFFDLVDTIIPIDGGVKNRSSLEAVKARLQAGELVCLFPEGTISRTGHLAEFRKGYEKVCEGLNKNIPIIPFYLHGLWGSLFSRSTSVVRKQSSWGTRRRIMVSFGGPVANTTPADRLKQLVFDLSISAWKQDTDDRENLGQRWVSEARQKRSHFFMADNTGVKLSSRQALVASTALAAAMKNKISGQNIGVLLPASVGGALTNMALLQSGKTLVNLNYTVGTDSLKAAFAKAGIQTVVTSSRFLSKLKQKGFDLKEVLQGKNIIELETVKAEISWYQKAGAWLLCYLVPVFLLKHLIATRQNADDTACILFSSGSEGTPKGICLSHKNIQANVQQTLHVMNPLKTDIIIANLPLFHAFGLTVTQFLPLISGIAVVFNTDPTNAVDNAKLIARYQASIMFGTSTFLRLYVKNRQVKPLMLKSLRLVVSGAEKLNAQVQQGFLEKFHISIYEGYGATETSPVVSVNMPDQLGPEDFRVQLGQRAGSVGMPLPGSSIRIVDPNSYEPLPNDQPGMILIAGVQIMQGYLHDEARTAKVMINKDGQRWYMTGDKGKLDKDGFLYILDRYSRFAKIGGEMISMGLIEQVIYQIYAEQTTAEDEENLLELTLVALPDDKRGEKLVLLANQPVKHLINAELFNAHGLSNLTIPAEIYQVDAVPKLASGKVDFSAAKQLAVEKSTS